MIRGAWASREAGGGGGGMIGGAGGSRHSAAAGQAEALAPFTRRALMRTSAPIFRSLRRIVPQVAAAAPVWASPIRRKAHRRTEAIEANHSRSWLARIVAAEVRSAKKSPWHSLTRFS